MRNLNDFKTGIVLVMAGMLLVSCSGSIADQVAGKWQRDNASSTTGTYTFERDENTTGGGTFVYSRVLNDTVTYESGIVMTANATYSLQGRWYIEDDAYDVPCDLHTSYDVNSIKADATNLNYHDTDGTTYTLNEVASLFGESANQLKETYLNHLKEGVRNGFKDDNDGDTFSGFTIVSLDENVLKAAILSDTDDNDTKNAKNDTIVYRRIQ